MKNILKLSIWITSSIVFFTSCKKFEQLNNNPTAANASQAQPEFFINGSIISAQMDPDVAERSFILYWKVAAHQQASGELSEGIYHDDWNGAYYNQVSSWLNSINTGIQLTEEQIKSNSGKVYTPNLLQVARIWRAYLLSEMSDNFGPVPINAFQGVNPEFSDVKTVYYYALKELTEATSAINETVSNPTGLDKEDPAYGYNYTKWVKFGNSLRMRLAMRLSEVDAAKAKTEFEAAVATNKYIQTEDDIFAVQEKAGWDALTGVMTREWDEQSLSPTLNNLMIGLGGVSTSAILTDDKYASHIKAENYIGQKYDKHFSQKSNDPSAGYWLDGIPAKMDPRAFTHFIPTGDTLNTMFCKFPSWSHDAFMTKRDLMNPAITTESQKTIDTYLTWNPGSNGDWGALSSLNQLVDYVGSTTRMSLAYRESKGKRIFFAPWENYFLIAEAALKGWAVPMTGKAAYEMGITKSFEHWNIPLNNYLSSQSYNRVGTSVSWTHTTEPGDTHTMNYVNGYTGVAGTVAIKYPKNDLYQNGAVKNDLLTKIITQKYIAQMPWLPLEAWNDRRRLGLPFFENPAIENSIPTIPTLNASTMMSSKVAFFPQRLKYPSGLSNSNQKGYQQAVTALSGADDVFTPLWWAKK